jgi:hypothetical protein
LFVCFSLFVLIIIRRRRLMLRKKPECGAVGQPNGLIQERVTFRHLRAFLHTF